MCLNYPTLFLTAPEFSLLFDQVHFISRTEVVRSEAEEISHEMSIFEILAITPPYLLVYCLFTEALFRRLCPRL